MSGYVPMKLSDNKNQATKEKSDNLFCYPCYQDGDEKTAEGFCVECSHYLCEECFKYHCRPLPMKGHKLLGKLEMPKRKVDESFSQICADHKGEMIKCYCKTHKTVGCHLCVITEHNTCQGICALEEIAKDVEQSTAYKDFCTRMEIVKIYLQDEIQAAKGNKEITSHCKESALTEINKLQQEINQKFEFLKQQIAKEAIERQQNDLSKIKQLEDSIKDTQDSLNNLREDFQILEETKQTKQLYIALNKSQDKLKILEQEVENIHRKNEVEVYSFVPNSFLKNINKIDSFGNLDIEWIGRESEKGIPEFSFGKQPVYEGKTFAQKMFASKNIYWN